MMTHVIPSPPPQDTPIPPAMLPTSAPATVPPPGPSSQESASIGPRLTGRVVLSSGNILFSGLYRAVLNFYNLRRKKLMIPVPQHAKVIFDPNYIGRFLALKNTAVLKTSFGYKYYSADKARKLIGWSPRYTINDSLKEIFIHSMSSSKF